MKTFSYTIKDAQGIHARPAGELVKAAKGFSSEIKIKKGGMSVDAKKIFGIMGLGAKQGDTDRKSTRLNSSHRSQSRMPSSA